MSMTIEKAIEYFTHTAEEKAALAIAKSVGSPQVIDMVTSIYEANELAAAALREKAERENPAPLTIDEMQKMDGQPVYVVPLESSKGKEWMEWCVFYTNTNEAVVPGIEYFAWNIKDYGKTWIAYRHKPKEDTP